MEEFIPYLSAPSISDKYFIHTSKGGLNDCILVGAKSVLPNCVGYAFGITYKRLGEYPKLSRRNAENWWEHNDGYERGQVPKLGAIACWSKGSTRTDTDGAGHVATVEGIESDGTIITGNSAYGGSRFFLKTIKPPYNLSGYTFQGFIYPPFPWYKNETNTSETGTNVKESGTTELPKLSVTEIAKQVIKGNFGNGSERVKNLTNAGYNYNEVQSEVNKILGVKTYTDKSSTSNTSANVNTLYQVGDNVAFDYFYTDSYASKCLKSTIHSGKITKIYKGRKAPYLINNGSGFLSDNLIIRKI